MDWHPIPFEPNLKFALDLKEDLKTKYYEQHERAKQSLAKFSCTLQNVYHEHQKLLADNIELSIINEKLKQISSEHEINKKVLTVNHEPSSVVISASTNCNLEITPKRSLVYKKLDKICDNEKENICEFVPIFSSDFNSDVEEGSFEKHNSPPPSVACNSAKVQNSPILSKRKRHTSKRSSSSISNVSITSSNDSKVSVINTSNNNEKIFDEIDNELKIEFEKKFDREPLHVLDNIPTTPKCQNGSTSNKILSVSKIDYGKTEFTEGGKKLRQTKLTLKKVVPVIDISKADLDDSFSKKDETRIKGSSGWNETFFSKETTNNNNKKEINLDKNVNYLHYKKESETKSDLTNHTVKKNTLNLSACDKDDELIETSPAQGETSKLRNKLSMNLKPEIAKMKARNSSKTNSEIIKNSNNIPKSSRQLKNECESNIPDRDQCDLKDDDNFSKPTTSKIKIKNESSASPGGKRKLYEPQRTFNDDTYFSPAEMTVNKNDITQYDEFDATDYKDELKFEAPPVKKMLMSSFDIIPGRTEKNPDYAYKEAPVRKKNERAQLPGWSCQDCERWYDHLPEDEKIKRQNECSRHRGKYRANVLTPESFWNPVFDDSKDSSSFDN